MRDLLRRTIYNRSYVLDIMVLLLLATTIFFLVGQHNLTKQLSEVAQQNVQLNQSNNDILKRVKSCTDPSGACYVQNTRRTGDAVDSIDKIIVLANACADRPGLQTVDEIEKCVQEVLKSH